MTGSWHCCRLVVLHLLTAAMITAVRGDSCTADDHRFYIEIWDVDEDLVSLTPSVFTEVEANFTGFVDTVSFNGNASQIWDPFRGKWPDEQDFDHFAVQITSRVCPCQNMSLLLYLSSDDGSLLFVDGEEVINMNRVQSVTDETIEAEFEAGVCKDIKLQYFDKENNQFLNLDFFQIQPPPPKDNLHRRPLAGDLVFLPESMVTCNIFQCDNASISGPEEDSPDDQEDSPGDQEDEKVQGSEIPNPPVDDPDTKEDDVDNQNETQEGDDEEENPEKDPVPCLQANTKEDGYVNGLCICKDGFSGVFCEASDTCDSGTVDKDDNCCPTSVRSKELECCEGSNPKRDKVGLCCSSGNLDACGVCDGESSGVDVTNGECCKEYSGNGKCCGVGEIADDCGICNGDNSTCDRGALVDLVVTLDDFENSVPPDSDVEPARRLQGLGRQLKAEAPEEALGEEPAPGPEADECLEEVFDISDLARLLATALGIRAQRVVVSREEECAQYSLKISRPTLSGDTIVTFADMESKLNGLKFEQYSLKVIGMNSIGVCKNRMCEYGERLNSGTSWECPSDCENIVPICPSVNEKECGEHGLCDRGECDCFEGYSGQDCNECTVCLKNSVCIIGGLHIYFSRVLKYNHLRKSIFRTCRWSPAFKDSIMAPDAKETLTDALQNKIVFQ